MSESTASGPRVPPHNLEAEASLLGAMLLKSTAIGDAVELLSAQDFHKPAHSHIFEAISTLYASGAAVDPVTVAEELKRAQLLDAIGGTATLVSLQTQTAAVSNASYYAKIVEENSILRRLVSTATDIAELGYTPLDDVSKTLDVAESMMYEVAQRRVADTMVEMRSLLDDSMDQLERAFDRGDAVVGVPSGYTDLDKILSGFQPGALVVLGARPAMGKTAFALGAAANAAANSEGPVVFFSLEMGHLELVQRLMASEGRIESSKLRNGQLDDYDWSRVTKSIDKLSNLNLWIDDNPNLTINEIRAKARRLKSRAGGISLIVIDYLQLMSGRANAESRQVEISEISRGLKGLARELEVPVIALSQLSRTLESRENKRPQLADLRESGAIEQDADVVMFLYRDEIYNSESPDKGSAEIIISKHRSGATGTCRLAFLDYCTRFDNMAKTANPEL